MAKRYSEKHIKEAIDFWQNELTKLNEAVEDHGGDGKVKDEEIKDEEIKDDSAEQKKSSAKDDDDGIIDVDSDDLGLESADSIEDDAVKNPVGKLTVSGRFHRLHIGSRNLVQKKLAELLNKYKALSDDNAVVVENSRDPDDEGFNIDGDDPMVITVRVQIDRAHVKGLRKLMAVLKEDDEIEKLDEGEIWSAIFKGIANMAHGVSSAAKTKIADANEALKKKIGVTAIQSYLMNFGGKKLAQRANLKNVFITADEEGDGAEYTICAAVNWSE